MDEPTDLYEDDNGQAEGLTDSTRWGDDMDTTDQPGEMPADILAGCTVKDPSDDVEGYLGRAGGTFDAESGVLELVYVPYPPEEMGEPDPEDDQYAPTTVRFVEVEKLLEVLASLGVVSGRIEDPNGEWWRAVLTEKLDAHKL